MKKIFFGVLLFMIFLMIPFCSNADELKLDREISADYGVCDVEKDSNNNIYYVGKEFYPYVKKYDENYNLIYSKEFENYNTCVSVTVDENDNVYLLCGENNHYFEDSSHNVTRQFSSNRLEHSHIIKIDSNGNEIFNLDLDGGYYNNHNNYSCFYGIKIVGHYLYAVGNRFYFDRLKKIQNEYNYYNYIAKSKCIKINLTGSINKETFLGEENVSIERVFNNDSSTSAMGGTLSIRKKDTTILFKDDKIYTHCSIEDSNINIGTFSTNLMKIMNIELGSNSSIKDITESDDGNYIAVGDIDLHDIDSSQISKRCPGIIKYSEDGDIISYKIIDSTGEFIALNYKDDGYYGIINLFEKNVTEFNNDSKGYFLVRYDTDFNLQDSYYLSGAGINLFDFDEKGITVLYSNSILGHFNYEFDYKVNVINSEEKGNLTINEDREYYPGEEVSFNTELYNGYSLKEVQVVDSEGNRIDVTDNTFIMPSSDVTVTPIYRKLNNIITLISKDETEEAIFNIDDLMQVSTDEIIKFRITAVTGYELENIIITDADNNEIEYEKEEDEYTFTMPESDVTIDPYYRAINTTSDEDEEDDNTEKEDVEEESNTVKEDKEEDSIIEKIKTEVVETFEKLKNPTTGDLISGYAAIGVVGTIILIIVISKKRRHSTKKSNIQF